MKKYILVLTAALLSASAMASTKFKAEVVCPIDEGRIDFNLTEDRIQTVFDGKKTELKDVKVILKGPGFRRIFETKYSIYFPKLKKSALTTVRLDLYSFRGAEAPALGISAYNPKTKKLESITNGADSCALRR